MEISRDLINPYPLPSPGRSGTGQSATERRFAGEQAAAENRTSEPAQPAIRGRIVEEKGSADYTEALQQTRLAQAREAYRPVTPAMPEPLGVQRALDAYRENTEQLDNGTVELLPRVDGYV